ncbi:HAD family hydrolase [Paenibacillus allorhizosphaerae]|uniref:HAD family hydrolase n=1 Tax=Paenibacillus allorhizosphaerae TaxID=2849866 RepID=A0ABM8VBA1_9BACL|nr:HAD family hydrolase [Paenibacillus allorhizosphaerae]CAG7619057.1 hypothetical protein PAECIP111802_00581 [Paenibacillus allorhizosphaerae]
MLRNSDFEISTHNMELWKYDQYLSEFVPAASDVRLLSLDVFDTLLLRACGKPSDVFLHIAEEAHRQAVLLPSVTPNEFASMRISAESQARDKQWAAHKHSEVTLHEIYEQFPSHVGDREQLQFLELEAEKRYCYLNPNIVSLMRCCRNQGTKVALVSDMYLSAVQMANLLEAAGLDMTMVDRILVSSETKGDKVSGRLFDTLLAAFPAVDRSAVIHIGDSYRADIMGAESRGIRSVHYNVIPETFESAYHWESIRHGEVLPELRSLRKLAGASLVSGDYDEKQRHFHALGAGMFGPFLQALCDWVIDICVQENRTAIHPLMREGYLLGPMLQRAVRFRGLDIQVVPIYVSRQAVYLPSLSGFGEAELESLLQKGVTVKEAFDLLQIEDCFQTFASMHNLSPEACEREAANADPIRDLLAAYLKLDPVSAAINAAIVSERTRFIAYLHQTCGEAPELLTLDIGFHGTIQTGIDAICRLANKAMRPIHLLAVGTSGTARLLAKGHDVRCFIGSSGEHADLAAAISRSPAFLEELSMGSFGSTLRYSETGNHIIEPVTASLDIDPEQYRYKDACQEGIYAYQLYYNYFCRNRQAVSADHRAWMLPFHRLIDLPTPGEAQLLGDLTHQDNHATEQTSICEPVDENFYAHGATAFLNACNYGPSTLNVFWPQGMAARRFPYYLYLYHLRLKDSFGGLAMFVNMMLQLKRNQITHVHVYGQGGMLDQVIALLYNHGLTADCVIDTARSSGDRPWGSFRYVSLMEASRTGNHVYIVASLWDTALKQSDIERAYEGLPDRPVIFTPSPEEPFFQC